MCIRDSSSSSLKNRLGAHFTISQIYRAKDASEVNNAFADKLQLQLHKSLLSGALDTPRCPTAASVTQRPESLQTVSYTHLRAHETSLHLVCRLLLEKKKKITTPIRTCAHLPTAPHNPTTPT
eukprot:TRINITY_DN20047_c0_g1_i1.p1 TRINITY_DN20047_c0_g1~~TRINITY_DN20047_c0_g1_i1.p1  ORF type:complete len:123 (-),score=13.09 TRINITY_DN20047_c0_g1_i1:28-396(-)